jgi:hypothetical protein
MISETEQPAVAPAAKEKLVWSAPMLLQFETEKAAAGPAFAPEGYYQS